MSQKLYKYPRTWHLPWSPHNKKEDHKLKDTEHFYGQRVVITTKMDGENTTLYRDYIHARSLSSADHPSRSWVKGLWGEVRHLIPEGMRICGENLYAKHSIFYRDLPSYFLVFNIWIDEQCLSWNDTLSICNDLGLHTVGYQFSHDDHGELVYDENLERIIKISDDAWDEVFADWCEGYVVRKAGAFHLDDWNTSIAKYVRRNHVQTDEHWMTQTLTRNVLKGDNHDEGVQNRTGG